MRALRALVALVAIMAWSLVGLEVAHAGQGAVMPQITWGIQGYTQFSGYPSADAAFAAGMANANATGAAGCNGGCTYVVTSSSPTAVQANGLSATGSAISTMTAIPSATCPSGYTEPSGDPYCEQTTPPTCHVGSATNPAIWAGSTPGDLFGGPATVTGQTECVEGCEFQAGMVTKGRATFLQDGKSCTPPPKPANPQAACSGNVGSVNGIPVCMPTPVTSASSAVPSVPSPPASVADPAAPWSLPVTNQPYPSGSAPSYSTGSTGGSSSSGGGGSSSGGGSTGGTAGGTSTQSGGGSSSSSSTTCTGSTCSTTTTASSPAGTSSSAASVTVPGGAGSSPYSAAEAGKIGLPTSNPFAAIPIPSLPLPSFGGACTPVDVPWGGLTLKVDLCGYSAAIRPVLDWALMCFAVLGAIVLVVKPRGE